MSGRAEPLRGKNVVVGVCGGIAAYKAAELVRLLVKAGAVVRVVMTRAAGEFIRPLTFQTLTGHPVATELFDLTQESEIGHIRLADRADLVVIAPATADAIARLAAGMGDDLLATVALATRAPLLIAPAMNVNMWEHPIVRANVRRLAETVGALVVGPGAGFLACRWTGPGRLAEPADIVEAAAHLLSTQDLAGRRVVVSAGPTYEAIDPVRFVGNRSSGKMGIALAAAAQRRGAEVTLILGPSAVPPPVGVATNHVETAAQLQWALDRAVKTADAVIMTAAVADYRPAHEAKEKLKRGELGPKTEIELVANPDLLATLGARRSGRTPLLVGFAAETTDVIANAKAKLASKKCDLVVANDVREPDAGFAVDTNHVHLVDREQVVEVPPGPKTEVAHRILDRVAALLAAPATRGSRAPGTSRTARAPRPRPSRAAKRR